MKVCENVYQIKIDFQVTPDIKRFVYVYLITGESCYLVDAGVAGCEEVIEAYMKKLGRSLSEIRAVFLTHAHPDHIGGAAAVKRLTGCKVYASAIEKRWIEDIHIQFKERPIPNFYTLVNESVKVDQTVKEGDEIVPERGINMITLETPGHSYGSLSYLLKERDVLFSGDAIPVPGDLAIFVDEKASEATLKKLMDHEKVWLYCPAWDRIYQKDESKRILEHGERYLQKLKSCVQKVDEEYGGDDEEVKAEMLCRMLGLENMSGNPLFKRSIQACRE